MGTLSDFEGPGNQLPNNSLTKRASDNALGIRSYVIDQDDEREMTLRDHWQVLRKHKLAILSTVAALTLLVTAWFALTVDYYEGHARVEVNLENVTPPPSQAENQLPALDMDPAYFATQMQIMKSPMVLERVVKALDLQQDEVFKRHMVVGGRKLRYLLRLGFLAKRDPWIESEKESPLVTSALDPVASADDLKRSKEIEPYVRDLQSRMTVEPVKEPSSAIKDTRLVSITVKHASPVLVARLANAIADSVVYSNRARKLQAGKTTNAYLNTRIDELQAQIREDERSLAAYASKHNILSLDPTQNMAIERLAALNRQLVEAENARKEAQANYEQVLGTTDTNQPAATATAEKVVGDDAANSPRNRGNNAQGSGLTAAGALAEQNAKQIADLEGKLAELRQKRAQLLVGATENWPEVREVDEQIASVQNSLASTQNHATSLLLSNLETKYRQERAHETAIRQSLDSQRRVAQIQNQDAVEYRLLQQQIETKKNLLNGYLKRFDGNDVAQAAITSNIRVVDYATLPGRTEAAGPWRLLYVIVAFLGSLMLGICLALFLEYCDDTIRSGDEVRQVMRLPSLAAIPAAQILGAQGLFQVPRLALRSKSAIPTLLFDSKVAPALVENYRRLRTAARSMMPENCKIMVVTSALGGEGKTTMTVNLGASLAQMHAPVLVIDGDTRQQRLSELFRMRPFGGLQELLAKPRELNVTDVLNSLQKHEPTGVFVLPAGRHLPTSPELLGSAQMRTLLGILSSRFSYILVDSPAVTACADALILSKIADCVLMVVESGKTSREIVRHAQTALEEGGARMLGVVLNKVRVAPHSHWYDSYTVSEAEPSVRAMGAASGSLK